MAVMTTETDSQVDIIPGTDVLRVEGGSQAKHWKGSDTVYAS